MGARKKAWAVMLAVFFASIASAVNQFKVPPAMQYLMADLGLDMVTAGWTMSIFSLAGIVLAIPAAFLLRRWGLKLTGSLAMGCTVAGAVLGALAPNTLVMLGARMLEGTGMGLIAIIAPAAISAWFPTRERGMPMGIWATWVPVGNVIMFNLAHPLLDAFGWRAIWWFGAILAAISLAVYALVVAEPEEKAAPGAKHAVDGMPGTAGAPSFGRALLNVDSWLLALIFVCFAFSLLGYNTWAPAYLADSLGMEPARASFAASMMFLAGIPGNLVAGWILIRTGRPQRLLVAAFALSTVLFAWSFRLELVAIVVPYMLALGFLTNLIPTTEFTLAPETMPSPSLAGLGLAILAIGSGVGILLGPPVLGAALDRRGWAAGSLLLVLVMAGGLATSVVVWWRARTIKI
jgi:MFS family permease